MLGSWSRMDFRKHPNNTNTYTNRDSRTVTHIYTDNRTNRSANPTATPAPTNQPTTAPTNQPTQQPNTTTTPTPEPTTEPETQADYTPYIILGGVVSAIFVGAGFVILKRGDGEM